MGTRVELPRFAYTAKEPYLSPRERVLVHAFSAKTKKWTRFSTEVAMASEPFSEGALRSAYILHASWPGQKAPLELVGKVSKDPNETKETYFKDVQAQAIANKIAEDFNNCRPPKKVNFVPAYVFEFVDRRGRPLMGAEPLLRGDFVKASNNVGGVLSDEKVSKNQEIVELVELAQCYSHFSYEVSSRSVLVCDIQGVGGLWTDPQIHSSNATYFGKGNLGETGIRAFLMRHKCKELCELLGLPKCTPSSAQTMMGPPKVPFVPRMLASDEEDGGIQEQSFSEIMQTSLEELASPRREEEEEEEEGEDGILQSPLILSGAALEERDERVMETFSSFSAVEVKTVEVDGHSVTTVLDEADDALMESIIAGA